MIIDLYDYDLVESKQPLIFNLEIMKLAAYYSKRRDYVKMLEKIPPENEYSSLFIQKDFEDYSDKAQRVFNFFNNVCINGKSIYGQYIPMEDNIEFIAPNTNIYNKLEKYFTSRNTFKTYLNAEHFRISCNEKDISLMWKKQIKNFDNKNFFIHDYNPSAINNVQEIFNYILSKNRNAKFGFKFPIEVFNEEQLKLWASIPCIKRHKEIHIYQLFNPILFAENIINLDTIVFHFNPSQWTEEETQERILEIYKYGLYFMERGVIFSLYIEEENKLDFYLKNILKALNIFFKRKKIISFVFFFNNLYLEISKKEEEKILQYIKSFFPSLYFLFIESNRAVIKKEKIYLEGFLSEEVVMKKQEIKKKVENLILNYKKAVSNNISQLELNEILQQHKDNLAMCQEECLNSGGHSFVKEHCIYCKALKNKEE